MRRTTTGILFLLTLLSVPAMADRWDRRGNDMSVSIDSDVRQVTSCNDIRVTFGDMRAVRAEEQIAAVSGFRSIKVEGSQNGGVHIIGTTDAAFSVTACKAAADAALLGQIRPSLSGNSLTMDGPDEGRWVAYFIVRAPRGSTVEAEARNGAISLAGFDGTANARAHNGPISIKDSTGTLDATTQNGPISIARSSGTVRLNAQNGPISVKLDGTSWERGSLEAHTQNGPLSLRIDRGFRSGVLVESLGHGPISCRADACRAARRNWNEDDEEHGRWRTRRIELGDADTRVRLSTKNGPVSVKELE